ncbi:MAG: preprotein translocase subunit YajC [Tissierellia bacterium]|nr:preprotein translocase subunit YajC [Tissierellia bacterium]
MKTEYILIIIAVVLYYFLVYKEERKLKEKKDYIKKNLSLQDRIKTKSGIYGKVVELNQYTALIKTGKDSFIEIDRNSIEDIVEDL